MTYHFSEEKRVKIVKGYKDGASIKKLAQKFGCSGRPIGNLFIKVLGFENYKKIAKEHQIKNGRKNLAKWRKEHPEEQAELGRKAADSKNFISSWEDKFYDEYLEPIFGYDLQRQYYIPEINHRFDFVILDSRVLIEVDGDYYHQFHEERDAQIDKWAKDNGWTMFRYSDKDLKKLGII